MKRLISIVAMLVMFWCSSAMALDQSGCQGTEWMGPQWQCNGRVELSDMGTMENSQFVPGTMWADILAWDGNMVNYQPFTNLDIPDGQLQVRNYSDRPGLTRVTTNIGMEVVGPVLWSVTCVFDGTPGVGDPNECPVGQEAFFMGTETPDGCVCDENGCGDMTDPTNPCAQYWPPRMEQLALEMMVTNRITVTWEDKGLIAEGFIQTYDAVFPKYVLYPMNFWDYNKPWSTGTDMIFQFPEGVVPAVGPQTVKIHIDADDPSGGWYTYKTYNVTTTNPMPTVAATKEVESGLKMTINGKEIKSGLKITWDDPPFKDIQKPGIQLRVYVGASNNGYEAGNLGGHEIFYWIDCPAQMHKLLIPIDKWNELKDALIAAGHNQAKILIVYRTIEGGDDAADEGQFMNRGHSDILTVDLL